MADEREHPQQENDQPKPDWNDKVYAWIEARPLAALLLGGGVVALLLVVSWAVWPHLAPAGTGFAYTVPQPGDSLVRTLWDWLGLLIVPLAVATGAAYISYVQKRTELEIAKKALDEDRELAAKARETEQQIANDRLRQATLEAYYDRMSELLLDHDLRNSAEDSEARSIARARTVAVVKGLDGERNRQLFAFLRTSKLIEKDAPIVDLRGADLRKTSLGGVDLSGIDLSRANLAGAILTGADLSRSILSRIFLGNTDLRWVDLSDTDLGWAYLGDADLQGATLLKSRLGEANLSGANLINANLIGAKLIGANLREANLTSSYPIVANLRDANLSGAILVGADLTGAVLIQACNWVLDQFDGVRAFEGATMPDGVQLRDKDNPDAPTYEEWKAQYQQTSEVSENL